MKYIKILVGIVWVDENSNGVKDDDESNLPGVKVYLLDVTINKIAKDSNGIEITGVTDKDGFYGLLKIKEGKYIVAFEYDRSQYYLTAYKKEGKEDSKTSKVISKDININGEKNVYGITDSIDILNNSVGNINMGLIQAKRFDMKLEKFINKISVKENKKSRIYQYDNENFAKIEVDLNKNKTVNVNIEYKIVVTNIGEIEGYVNNIVDYLPNDVDFSVDNNKGWYKKDNNIYNNSLENEKISVGESKILTVIVTKTINENNTGSINNVAEIKKSFNEFGLQDINSVPDNKKQGENDIGSAVVLISIKTGGVYLYLSIIIAMAIIIVIGIYFIKKKNSI